MARPHGEIAQALLTAAEAGPGTVRELATRGQVGWVIAQYTACRLVAAGHLVAVDEVRHRRLGRPAAVLALPAPAARGDACELVDVLSTWHRRP